jgi:hypothetical protein
MIRKVLVCTATAVLAAAVACSKSTPNPTSPSASAPAGETAAAADGSTLKVNPSTAVSPINGEQPDTIVLTATKATGKFTQELTPSYEFEIYNAANTRVYTSGVIGGVGSGNNVTHQPASAVLEFDQPHTWRVRAVLNGAQGPWSAPASFKAPVGAFVRGNEVFDPLTTGVPSKVINASNDVTWIPGVGVRLNSKDSYVEWKLSTPCVNCEFSALMTNIGNGSEEWKTKVMSMLEQGVNTTENRYRVTIDKRTTWVGQGSRVRYTICSGPSSGSCSEPVGGFQSWDRSRTYFWKFEWRNLVSHLLVLDGGINGSVKANLTQSYKNPYQPNPHLVRLGSVGGRADNETNPGTIVWNVWVSPNPRPNLPGDK